MKAGVASLAAPTPAFSQVGAGAGPHRHLLTPSTPAHSVPRVDRGRCHGAPAPYGRQAGRVVLLPALNEDF
jgi:hypothetical protein